MAKRFAQRLDKAAATTILMLSIPLGLLLYAGDKTTPKIRAFSWQNRAVDAKDVAFILSISIVPISSDPSLNTIEYLPQLMKFNRDGTRSLLLVTKQGTQKELLKTNGYILKAQFDPMNHKVYCLHNKLSREKRTPQT